MSVVRELFRQWSAIDLDDCLDQDAVEMVMYLSEKLFDDYEPDTVYPFLLRLEKWLENVSSEDDKKILISLLAHIFFAGRDEFESLSRTTISNVYRWIIEKETIDISRADIGELVRDELEKTWICPITDSLRINAFLKLTNLKGHDLRPDWRSLSHFSEKSRIDDYLRENDIQRLVLLEDFVGSGIQSEPAISFACREFPNLDILFAPLIICPLGENMASDLTTKFCNLSYQSGLTLPEKHFLNLTPMSGEPRAFQNARELIKRNCSKTGTPVAQSFGFQETGALVVLFSNCPDNTLPIFSQETSEWQPLFPRVWRPE